MEKYLVDNQSSYIQWQTLQEDQLDAGKLNFTWGEIEVIDREVIGGKFNFILNSTEADFEIKNVEKTAENHSLMITGTFSIERIKLNIEFEALVKFSKGNENIIIEAPILLDKTDLDVEEKSLEDEINIKLYIEANMAEASDVDENFS